VKLIRILMAWAIAVVVAVVLGSLAQSGFNLAALAELGVELGAAEWIGTAWHDLLNFTPTYALLVAIAFAIAWPLAATLKRAFPGHRGLLFTLAGFSAIWTTIAIMNRALPVTGIAATREIEGTLALAIAGALAGWLYARLTRFGNA
jgi:hypothetical protein